MKIDQQTPIAFLGMGLMGTRMTSRLLKAGYTVAVWNRSQHACDPLIQEGALAFELEEIAKYPVILTCLADDKAVQSVFAQIESYLQPNQIIVDFSSLSVAATLELAQASQEQQVTWI
ncbi:NAD(P)-binding domain-containing protein, partial [Acinetobacter venetianus]|uniref:NAD(P)-binding domain-containing protein n=1 Tax=Acinetobacter venetianus TaxID=52133 RepID=UPI00241EF4CC